MPASRPAASDSAAIHAATIDIDDRAADVARTSRGEKHDHVRNLLREGGNFFRQQGSFEDKPVGLCEERFAGAPDIVERPGAKAPLIWGGFFNGLKPAA